MTREPGRDGRCGIGARLRAGRERSGLSLLQAAERLHVDPVILEALEAEDFGVLGPPVFTRGHIRRYAQLGGEPVEPLLDLYAQVAGPDPTPTVVLPAVKPERPWSARWVIAVAAGLLATIAAATGYWLWQRQPAPPPAVGIAQSAASPPSVGDAESVAAAASAARPAAAASAPATPVPPAPVPVAVAQDDAPVLATLATRGSALDPAGSPAPALTLRFAADSWLQVRDARQKRLFEGTATAGSVHALSGTRPLQVVLGNVEVISIEVDGKPAQLPSDVVRGRVARFTVGADGALHAAWPRRSSGS